MMSDGLIFNQSPGQSNMLFFGGEDSILRGNFPFSPLDSRGSDEFSF